MNAVFAYMTANSKAIAWVVAAIIVLAGGGYSAFLGDRLSYSDEKDYYGIASRLAETGNYTANGEPTAFRPPGYVFLLAAVQSVGGAIEVSRGLNFVFLAMSVLLLSGILRQSGLPLAAAWAPLLVLAYPVLFYTAGTLYPQTFGAMLLLAFLRVLYLPAPSVWTWVGAGALYGLLVLVIPVYMLLAPLVGLWLILSGRLGIKGLVLLVGTALVVVGSWTGRNYATFGAFIPVSTNSGVNLWAGNSLYAEPNSGVMVAFPPEYMARVRKDVKDLKEVGRRDYYRNEAMQFIKGNPSFFVTLYARKFLNYFNYHNKLAGRQKKTSVDWIMLATYGPLLLLGVLRFLLAGYFRPTSFEWLCLSLYLGSAAVYALFFTRIRFRLPFDLLLIGVVAVFVGHLVQHWLAASSSQERAGPICQ